METFRLSHEENELDVAISDLTAEIERMKEEISLIENQIQLKKKENEKKVYISVILFAASFLFLS